jgi:hypothetical protein
MPNFARILGSLKCIDNRLKNPETCREQIGESKLRFAGYTDFSYYMNGQVSTVDDQGKPLQIMPHQVSFLNIMKELQNHGMDEFRDCIGRYYKSPRISSKITVNWYGIKELGTKCKVTVNITSTVSWFDEYGTSRKFTVTESYSGKPF